MRSLLKTKKDMKGITLIALVITIIVLLILAGVTIATLTGNNGILAQATKAKGETENATKEEEQILEDYENKLNEYDPDRKSLKIVINSGEDKEMDITYTSQCTIDWGDGTTEKPNESYGETKKVASKSPIKVAELSTINHIYPEKNKEYTITITGNYNAINSYKKEKIIKITNWGETGLESIYLDGCINLTEITAPTENSFKDLRNVTFSGSGIQAIPDKMFADCKNIYSFNESFIDCTNLTTIGDNAFSGCSNVGTFRNCFNGCQKLETIGKDIFKNCDKVTDYVGTFANCSSLAGNAPELWLLGTNSKENDYQGNPDGGACFYGCSSLDNYNEIPNYWKEQHVG